MSERKPLWASSLADQPRSGFDDVIVRVLEEEPETDPAPPSDRPPPDRRPLAAGIVVAIGFLIAAVASGGTQSLRIEDVPSNWGDIPMTCHTVRLEREDGAGEWFWCRSLGAERLPPGQYSSPQSQWASDLTRRDASKSRIEITPDGELAGWAMYDAR